MFRHTKISEQERQRRDLLGVKEVKIGKFKFLIKKINPILDFHPDKIPQIFTYYQSKRPITDKVPSELEIRRVYESMYAVIEAGLYEPKLSKMENGDNKWHEKGLTLRDLFLEESLGYGLYIAIMAHTMNRFKGMLSGFFLRKIRHLLSIRWPLSSANLQPILSLGKS